MRLNRNYSISSFSPSIPFNSLIPVLLLLIIFNDTNSSVFPNRLLTDNLILKAQLRFKRGAVSLDKIGTKLVRRPELDLSHPGDRGGKLHKPVFYPQVFYS